MEHNYKVRAIQGNGNVIEGSITASSRDEVISILKSRNQSPIQITEEAAVSKSIIPAKLMKKKVKVSDLSIFCRQLSAMIDAGMPINRALDVQVAQVENPTLREALQSVSISIKQGESLSRSMKNFPDAFPMILRTMVEAGEATGKIDEVLDRMSNHYIKENRINNKVRSAMIYPILLIVVTIIIVIVMMIFVVPMFEDMFSDAGMTLPAITRMVLAISRSLQNYWYIYASVVGGTIFAIKKFINTEKGRYWFDTKKLNFKLVSKAMRQIVTARFTRTMSTLLASGISIVDAVTISAETTNNTVVMDSIDAASDGIKRGMSLSSELKKTGLFPLMMLSMVSIGEETGNIDDLLLKTADYYDEELDEAVQKLISLLEPIMIIVMGVIVGIIVMSIMIPMFTMSTSPEMMM